MGEEVVRGHEVHVVNSLVLVECYQSIRDLQQGPLPPQTFLGDLIILTEEAAEGTAAEKDRSGAVLTADRGFFTQVGLNGGDAHVDPLPAPAQLIRGSVHTTAARTELTGLVVREQRLFQGFQERHGEQSPLVLRPTCAVPVILSNTDLVSKETYKRRFLSYLRTALSKSVVFWTRVIGAEKPIPSEPVGGLERNAL